MTPADQLPATFHWRGGTYDAEYGHVVSSGGSLVDLLAPRTGEHVLDLGCGTGTVTAQIADRGATVHGLDNSESMIAEARRRHPGIRFDLGDAEALTPDAPYDAVFCNSALHWMAVPTRVFGAVSAALAPGGRFVAEVPVVGSLAELRELLLRAWEQAGIPGPPTPTRWRLRPPQTYLTGLAETGFTVTSAQTSRRERTLDGGMSPSRWWSRYGPEVFHGLSDSQRARLCSTLDDLAPPDVGCGSTLLRFRAHRSRDSGPTAAHGPRRPEVP
ncbi:trans-aconitate 2-methyltransferase [Micromonospora sp. S-DT3-3-22]|uniref:class I SAM-dependent methyltransferase n=1 Tax=Micromonospora sp. S-DT3-3-22 TaxID=2755359 RepID=UPI00188EEC37|nr:class I SAM-dependent methyltransferase [Micromonospora sp. S-DT3-3-22]